jgi:hypothetical protein
MNFLMFVLLIAILAIAGCGLIWWLWRRAWKTSGTSDAWSYSEPMSTDEAIYWTTLNSWIA